MFLELTDHLRCPADHDEAFLVLLPDAVAGGRVRSGELGCPVCQRVVRLQEGVAVFEGAPAAAPPESGSALTAEAVLAFLGLSGPGGYVALVGTAGVLGERLAQALPGIRLVAVNPPGNVEESAGVSVLRAPRLPLKRGSMRGVVVGTLPGGGEDWVRAAAAAVLPGLRLVVEGEWPQEGLRGVELLAAGAGVWVGKAGGAGA